MRFLQKSLSAMAAAVMVMMIAITPVFAESSDTSEESGSSSEVEVYTSGEYGYTLYEDKAALVQYTGAGTGEITVPDTIDGYTVNTIGDQLYISKTGITKIVIPDSIENIGVYSFYGCTSLKEFEVEADSPYYTAVDGVLYMKESDIIMNYPPAKTGTEYTIPDGVTEVDFACFANAASLEVINLPDSLEKIGDWAFAYCSSLTELSLPENLTSLGAYAYVYCNNIASIEWPEALSTINNGAFGSCQSLKKLDIPEGVTTINNGAFSDCTGLTDVKLPSTLTSLGYGAFANCTGLTTIDIPQTTTTINNNAVGFNFDSTGEMVANTAFIIKGKTGSEAESYASEYGMKFISTGEIDLSLLESSAESGSESETDKSSESANGSETTSNAGVSATNDNSNKDNMRSEAIIIVLIIAAGISVFVIMSKKNSNNEQMAELFAEDVINPKSKKNNDLAEENSDKNEQEQSDEEK